MRTLYVSDMDGTLLDSKTRIPQQVVSDINEAISKGALFTVATARTPATLSSLLEGINMQLPAVVMTGATTWHPDTGLYTNTHHFAPATAREILNVYETHRLPSFVYTLCDHIINIYHYGPLNDLEADFIRVRLTTPFKRFHLSPLQQKQLNGETLTAAEMEDVWDESRDFIPEKISDGVLFFAMQPEEVGAPAYADLRKIENINPMFYFDTVYPGNAMIEAFPAAATKAKAIKALAKELGVERIVAFGDNRNDLPMLRMADIAVAVDNAIDEVKAEADIIIGNNNDGAVARFILNDFQREITM